MVTKSEAEAIVQAWLDENKIQSWHQGELVEEVALAIGRIDEHLWGWMFFYNTKRCIETGDFRYALGGNSPVYVTRDGVFHEAVTGSAAPPEEHLKLLEARLSQGKKD